MLCKNCGFNIKNDWKYCPNCSKKIYKKRNVIFISIILFIILIIVISIISVIKNYMPVDDKYIEKKLEKKYNEDFNNITLIKSEGNSDTDLSCDGTYFGTINGEGSTKYYKVHSKKNNIEFIATYDTSDNEKIINDSYKDTLKKRSTLIETYNIINKYLKKINYEVTLTGHDNKININSQSQLNNILSIYEEKYIDLNNINIYIDENLYDFCKSNYKIITKLNDEIVNLQRTNKYNFSTNIVLNESATISLYRLNDKAYVYDKYGNSNAWGKTLDEFVTRES